MPEDACLHIPEHETAAEGLARWKARQDQRAALAPNASGRSGAGPSGGSRPASGFGRPRLLTCPAASDDSAPTLSLHAERWRHVPSRRGCRRRPVPTSPPARFRGRPSRPSQSPSLRVTFRRLNH